MSPGEATRRWVRAESGNAGERAVCGGALQRPQLMESFVERRVTAATGEGAAELATGRRAGDSIGDSGSISVEAWSRRE
ncbi:unnamed protein product [Lampetra fluviatilis]